MQRSDVENKLIYLLETSQRINDVLNEINNNGIDNTGFMFLYDEREPVVTELKNFIEINKGNFIFNEFEQNKYDQIIILEEKNIKLLKSLTDKISTDIKNLGNSKKLLKYMRQR